MKLIGDKVQHIYKMRLLKKMLTRLNWRIKIFLDIPSCSELREQFRTYIE